MRCDEGARHGATTRPLPQAVLTRSRSRSIANSNKSYTTHTPRTGAANPRRFARLSAGSAAFEQKARNSEKISRTFKKKARRFEKITRNVEKKARSVELFSRNVEKKARNSEKKA
jgi:hypothetical protein